MIARLLLLISVGLFTAGVLAAADSPQAVVSGTATAVADRLDGRRDYLRQHPQELYGLVNEVLLPNFDTRYAGFLVLGRQHWKAASDLQRDRFVATFFDFLVRSYAEGLLDFDPASLEILPHTPSNDDKRATVQTRLRQDNGGTVPVNYRLRQTDSGWKVYDVRVEGVSYLQNYRNQFNAEISARGLDAVIARLENEGRSGS